MELIPAHPISVFYWAEESSSTDKWQLYSVTSTGIRYQNSQLQAKKKLKALSSPSFQLVIK